MKTWESRKRCEGRAVLWALLAVVLAGIAFGVVRWTMQQREPMFEGRPYSAYMLELGSTDKKVHDAARAAVTDVGTKALPFLIRVMDSESEPAERRSRAAMALGALGKAAKSAAPSLIRGAEGKEFIVRNSSLYALGRVPADPEKTLPLYLQCIGDSNPQIRQKAAFNLGRMNAPGQKAIDALKSACSDSDKNVRTAATNSFENLMGTASPTQKEDAQAATPP